MVCRNCGSEMAETSRFCLNCGADLTENAEPETKKKKGLKTIIIAAAAVVVIAAIVIGAVKLFGGGRSAKQNPLYVSVIDGTIYITSDGDNVTKCEDVARGGYSVSLWLDAVAYKTRDCELYIWKKGSAERIASDVEYFFMCADGSAVAYVKDDKLNIWKGGKTENIAKDIEATSVKIAPDGSAVGYVIRDDDGESTGYIWKGSRSMELGEGRFPFAISAGGKYIYYQRYSDGGLKFYVQKGVDEDTKVKLLDSGDVIRFLFNCDGTEVCLLGEGGTYISINGGEKTKVCSTNAYPVLPKGVVSSGDFLGVTTFRNMYFYDLDGKAFYLDSRLETSSAAKNADSFQVDESGKTLFFMKDDSIRKIDGTDPSAESVTIVDEEAYDFAISGDGKTVVYRDEDDELYFVKKNGKAERLGSDVDYYALLGNDTLFFISDDELFRVQNGKREKITELKGEPGSVYEPYNILARMTGSGCVTVKTNDDGDVFTYVTFDGKSFKLIAEE